MTINATSSYSGPFTYIGAEGGGNTSAGGTVSRDRIYGSTGGTGTDNYAYDGMTLTDFRMAQNHLLGDHR